MGTISSKPIRKTSRLDELIKLDRFLKFDEGDIIDSATTDRFFIRGMNENSFDLSFGVRFNVPENVSFSIEKKIKTLFREIPHSATKSLIAPHDFLIE